MCPVSELHFQTCRIENNYICYTYIHETTTHLCNIITDPQTINLQKTNPYYRIVKSIHLSFNNTEINIFKPSCTRLLTSLYGGLLGSTVSIVSHTQY